MFLNSYIGENIFLCLRKIAEQNTVLNYFYDVNNIIFAKLMDVDEIGIWLEGSGTMTKIMDDNGKEIPKEKQISEKRSTSILVRWEYIDDIYVLNPGEKKTKLMGFRFDPTRE
ncbi:hypothetical protein [Ruminiclostridium cellobioparum]|jgi:hypothetical protein|uniref:Uncharacterized protein n=1 Tax=Ruminiclostridium cellobioparum subsp. termitidis CT1112 TaxID=1195236 RepID=S0FZJ5_RUMCE|nr:hypothetical protein [Ruminiclostridium cellobioparum]EMS73958.1 hypothetical protein CTER_5571 [Ruminiclostridium cellobioparum subsp. termitidis CT1112]